MSLCSSYSTCFSQISGWTQSYCSTYHTISLVCLVFVSCGPQWLSCVSSCGRAAHFLLGSKVFSLDLPTILALVWNNSCSPSGLLVSSCGVNASPSSSESLLSISPSQHFLLAPFTHKMGDTVSPHRLNSNLPSRLDYNTAVEEAPTY